MGRKERRRTLRNKLKFDIKDRLVYIGENRGYVELQYEAGFHTGGRSLESSPPRRLKSHFSFSQSKNYYNANNS